MDGAGSPRGTDRQAATILVVDGEEASLGHTAGMLDEQGFHVISSGNSITALDLYEKQHAGIDLVILDMIMPGISGPECLAEMLRIDATAKIVMTCGHPVESYRSLAQERGAAQLIAKPYEDAELIGTVERILGETG